MNKEARKRWIERGKNVLIAGLTCSAVVLLFSAQQSGSRVGQESWISSLYQTLTGSGGSAGTNAVLLTETVRPVRMAVTTEQGRYGVQYDDEKLEDLFQAVNPLLTESMAAYGAAEPGTEEGWREALSGPGIYFDFLGSVPLDALTVQSGGPGGTPRVRRALLALQDGEAWLWYWDDGDGAPYRCALTETLRDQLDRLLEQYANDDGSCFAFEREEYAALSPWQLVSGTAGEMPAYQASNPLSGNSSLIERLVQTVGFNPHALYTVSGDWVVKDGTDTLRIRSDGEAVYTSSAGESGAARLPVSAAGETAAPAEAVESARELVEQTLGQSQGAARVYLISCTETETGGWEVRFGYLLNGAEVRLNGDRCCASVTISGRQIVSFTLRYRSYTAVETQAPVLPLRQAMAAMLALEPAGGELLLCYPDGGGDGQVQAAWAVRTEE